jgi:hypothetical protein
MMPYFHYDNYEYHVTYTLNPHWKYWLLVVGILLIITLYLRRDLLIKLHKATGLFIVIGYSIIFVACNTNNKKDDKPLPQNFNELTFLEITALPNGNAYAKSLDGGLWYLKGAEAIKVREVCQIISDTTRGRGFAHPYDETDPLGVKSKKKY